MTSSPPRLIKAEGAGNDFLLGTGSWARRLTDDAALVTRLCDRRRGIGADGVLAVFEEDQDRIQLVHRNSDGSPSAFCANGTRCAARAAVVLLGCEPELVVATGWTEIPARVTGETVTLQLPSPEEPTEFTLESEERSWRGRRLVVGVPHFVIPVPDLSAPANTTAGLTLRSHPSLGGEGANIHFVEDFGDGSLGIRSFERGVETEVLCCGSGVAAAALLALADTEAQTISVVPGSGASLEVEALGPAPMAPSRLTGPARLVAEIKPLDE